jgi:hypothetical protein
MEMRTPGELDVGPIPSLHSTVWECPNLVFYPGGTETQRIPTAWQDLSLVVLTDSKFSL